MTPLGLLAPGTRAEVVEFREMSRVRLARLSAFGLVPGSTIEIVQRHPAPVVRIGQTELALGREILSQIMVQRLDDRPEVR